jgi:hypothetical protein
MWLSVCYQQSYLVGGAWQYTTVIPANQEVEVGGSQSEATIRAYMKKKQKRAGDVAQVQAQGPEFKPQCHQEKKEKKNLTTLSGRKTSA